MKRRLLIGVVVATGMLLGACERREPQPHAHQRPHPSTAQQRFFAGQARPGEFLTLQSLPPVPESFEEPQR